MNVECGIVTTTGQMSTIDGQLESRQTRQRANSTSCATAIATA
jgi:hypothetical protein